jgi:hypothetical protein
LFQNTFADCPAHMRLTTSDPDTNGLDRVNLVTRADSQIPSYGGASKILFDFEWVQSRALVKSRVHRAKLTIGWISSQGRIPSGATNPHPVAWADLQGGGLRWTHFAMLWLTAGCKMTVQ